MTKQAAEIYQKPVADIDLTGLPSRGTPDFDQALILRYAMGYAARGWNAVVTVDDQYVRVVAVPEQGIEPKDYVMDCLTTAPHTGVVENTRRVSESVPRRV